MTGDGAFEGALDTRGGARVEARIVAGTWIGAMGSCETGETGTTGAGTDGDKGCVGVLIYGGVVKTIGGGRCGRGDGVGVRGDNGDRGDTPSGAVWKDGSDGDGACDGVRSRSSSSVRSGCKGGDGDRCTLIVRSCSCCLRTSIDCAVDRRLYR